MERKYGQGFCSMITRPKTSSYPNVSVIMPIRNESYFIGRSLNAVVSQDFPPDHLEIIIVDGMSTDGTRDLIHVFTGENSNIKLLDNPSQIVPSGLNWGIQQAIGDIIIRIDGHCEISPDYIRNCVNHIHRDGFDGVGGSIDTVGETWVAQAIAAAMSSPFGVGDSAFRTTQGQTKEVDTVPFPAYKREIILRAGLYDEELVRNQDDEYNYRIRELGGRILLAADLRSRYYSRGKLTSLWRQYYQYGYWKVRVLQKHPRQMRPRQFVPPLFVASLFLAALLALFHPLGRYLLALILAPYLLADLGASLWTAHKIGWPYLPLLPLVYPVMHISYGLGFLVGLVKFANRWGDKVGQVPTWQDDLKL